MTDGRPLARSLLKQSDRVHRGGSFVSGPGKVATGPKPPHGVPDYTFPMATRKIDSNSTDVDITSSTTEATVVSVSAPALSIRSEGATRLMASGTIYNKAAAAGTVTFKVKAADGTGTATVLETSGIVCSTSTEFRKWNLETFMFGNAENIQTHWGAIDVSAASAFTLPASTFNSVGYSTSALTETDIINVTVTAQLSAASTGFRFVRESAIFEAVT
jgi:hypothetical protein